MKNSKTTHRIGRCLLCDYSHHNIGSTLYQHLKTKHHQKMKKGENWDYVEAPDAEASPESSVAKKERKEGKNIKCLHCSKTVSNLATLRSHVVDRHGAVSVKKGVDWVYTRAYNKVTEKKPAPAQKSTLITAEMRYVDVHAILRIPVTIGKVMIVPKEEESKV